MFDIKDFFKKENEKVKDSYPETLTKIMNILDETEKNLLGEKKEYYEFFNHTAKWILKMAEYEKKVDSKYFNSTDFDTLKTENLEFYQELLPENYQKSYANPTYCVEIFGDNFGQLLSHFYTLYRNYIFSALQHRIYRMDEYNKYFIEVYEHMKNESITYETLKENIISIQLSDKKTEFFYRYNRQCNPAYRFYLDIVENDDLADLRYLYKMGEYITENDIRMAKFMNSYSEKKISTLAKMIVKAYLRGFERDNKDVSKKTTVSIIFRTGMEKLYREIIKEFRKKGLESAQSALLSSNPNKQYAFDHKFDGALFYSQEYIDSRLEDIHYSLEQNSKLLADYSGLLYVILFGEHPFSPENKPANLKLSEEQTKLFQLYNMKFREYYEQYASQADTSFCIVSFPTPEIGEQFEEIFAATVEINMLDSDEYEQIQQKLIDVLDNADIVLIKGKGENCTDLIVKLQELKNPEKETNFVNSGAAANIPAGEVFTAPQLVGTNGTLHVEETYQGGLRYDNLKLIFKDGYLESYSCTNFDTEKENKKYIEENLLFPHKTLPMGEFAIGTNTLAYVMSKKYNIMNILPVLILEKTGPHFALGDTCFSRNENSKSYNQINKKLICSKDNEKSCLRNTDRKDEAYTNKHSDITLAFSSIDFITAFTKEGEKTDLIKDGLFVLKGTEELNIPLKEFANLQ